MNDRQPSKSKPDLTSPCGLNPEDLVAWFYGELGQVEADSVREHVEECESCRRESEDLRQLSTTLDQWTADPSPTATVLSGLKPSTPKPDAKWKPVLIGLAASIIGFVALSGFGASFERHERGLSLNFGDGSRDRLQTSQPEAITKADFRRLLTNLEDRQDLLTFEMRRTLQDDLRHAEDRQGTQLVGLALRFEDSMRRDRETLSRMLDLWVEDSEIRTRRVAGLMVSRALDDNFENFELTSGEEK